MTLGLGLWSGLSFRRKVNDLALGLGLWFERRLKAMVWAYV